MKPVPIQSRPRLPEWLKKKAVDYQRVHQVKAELRQKRLHTVCEEARCPNMGECFERRTATLMLMGDICTRSCGFCSVKSGRPKPLDTDEPENAALQIKALGLRHAVLTSVDRDDLPDGGAAHIAATILACRRITPETKIEVLTPDFKGEREHIAIVCNARPDVFSHNIETVERITPQVRSKARYRKSLSVLQHAKDLLRDGLTKSGIMLGLGERPDEVVQTLHDLRAVGVSCVTIGQYLQPAANKLPVQEFVRPEQFDEYKRIADDLGFEYVFCGPFVRSSYMAEQVFHEPEFKKASTHQLFQLKVI